MNGAKRAWLSACGALLAFFAGTARADVLTTNTSNLGWYRQDGTHQSYNYNTLTGKLVYQEYRSFYLWSVPSFSGTVTAAKLAVNLPYSLGVGNPYSIQTGAIFDVSSENISRITADNGNGHGVQIFEDLGTGTQFGAFTISEKNNGSVFTVDLNQDAIAQINSLKGGVFAVGISNTTPNNQYDYFLFSSLSVRSTQELILDVQSAAAPPVPEPETFAMLLAGLGVISVVARRRHNDKQQS